MERREVKREEIAPNKLGESNQAIFRRRPPIQRHPHPKLSSRSQASLESSFGEIHLEKKSDLEEVLLRSENKIPRSTNNCGERVTYIQFVSKIYEALQASPHLDTREW